MGLLVNDQIENNLDSSVVASLDQIHAVLQRSVRLMDVLVVADVVTLFCEFQSVSHAGAS